jgi:hypothetical protein
MFSCAYSQPPHHIKSIFPSQIFPKFGIFLKKMIFLGDLGSQFRAQVGSFMSRLGKWAAVEAVWIAKN